MRRSTLEDVFLRITGKHWSTMIAALRIVQRNALVYRRIWRGSVFSSFLHPTLFLLAMVGSARWSTRQNAASRRSGFLFVPRTGLLGGDVHARRELRIGWPILGKMTWQRNYEAISRHPCASSTSSSGTWLDCVRLTCRHCVHARDDGFRGPALAVALLGIPRRS